MGVLKYIVFFGTFLFGVPFGFFMAQRSRLAERIVFFIMMFFSCRLYETINFVSRENYRGTAKGFEVTLVDLATITIFLLIISRRRQFKLELIPPGSIIFFFYFIFSALSIINAAEALYSFFELWKMIRMYFFFWVLYNYLSDFERFDDFFRNAAFIMIYIFFFVLNQKYREGLWQCRGPFPHQNSLVMYTIIFSSMFFARFLNKDDPPKVFLFYLTIFGMCAICIVSTLSRAGMACFAISSMIVLALSFLSGINAKKVTVTILIILGGIGVIAKSYDSVMSRIESAPESSKNTRIALAISALNMANDKTIGVGLNNWGIKVNPPYPYSNHIFDGPLDDDYSMGIVETCYLMIAAETGWYNLAVFLIYIFFYYFKNIVNYFKYRKHQFQFVSIGLAGGLTAIYLESTLEWVLKQTNNFYQLMMVFALIASMVRLRKSKTWKEDNEEYLT